MIYEVLSGFPNLVLAMSMLRVFQIIPREAKILFQQVYAQNAQKPQVHKSKGSENF